jgi:8-oxo-dGTP pyrophosphatase MutT (NUDIX family)
MNGPAAISMFLDGGKFNFRVAGIAVQNDKLLLHKTPSDHFWSLPGGRADMFEFTRETLLREMLEETGLSAEVGDLLWIVENFFEYDQIRYHEIGFYYKMEIRSPATEQDFTAIEEGSELLFHWHPLGDLSSIKIYPDFITKELIQNTSSIRHIVTDFKNLND